MEIMPMNSLLTGKPDVLKREAVIISYLNEKLDGATAREIYEDVSNALNDTISRPAYYKILDRLVVAGKIEQIDNEQGIRRFFVLPNIHATNRVTLDDVYEMLPFVNNVKSMAYAVEAQRYFHQHRDTVISETAKALAEEPAVNVFFLWIDDLIKQFQADLDSFNSIEQEGIHKGQSVLADGNLENRLINQCEILRDVLYRYLSISQRAVSIPIWKGGNGLKHRPSFHYNPQKLREELEKRVFGIGEHETFLGLVAPNQSTLDSAKEEMIISGSDGSFHAGTLNIQPASGYVENDSTILTFNNSVAYIRSSKRLERQKGAKKFLHSAPVTRDTLNDPTYKGMLLAPFMFPTLSESEYEHMARAASDVVQMRVDDEVFNGKARDIITGEQIVPPRVHIRDGTITPQERGFNHYTKMDPYGDIAREGIVRSRSILQRIVNSNRNPQLYVGCVKSTQLRLFSRFINWYISKGSRITRGKSIDSEWEVKYAGFISDVDVMSVLLANDGLKPTPNQFWMSCVVLRQFASLTDFYDIELYDKTWFDFLIKRRNHAIVDNEQYGGELPYHAIISEDDLADDAYLYMLERGDYASFYIGHTWGDPLPKVPRYEFLCSLRDVNVDEAKKHVRNSIEQIAVALLTCSFSLDRDHNFLSSLTLTKIIPSVVHEAHTLAKTLGKKLEQEFKSNVVQRLSARLKKQIDENNVEFEPVSIWRYLQRFVQARKALPPSKQNESEH
jgi:Fe2+ or Zn2+ uptake regulation protein